MTIWVVIRENTDDPSELIAAYTSKKDAEEFAAKHRPQPWSEVVVKQVELYEEYKR